MAQKLFDIVLFMFLITILSSMYCISTHHYNQKYRKVRNIYGPNLNFLPYSYNYSYEDLNKTQTTSRISVAASKKKWQVSRLSRKQYEIINMLWKKTKIFIDLETTTYNSGTTMGNSVRILKASLSRPYLQTSTASDIEFYYIEENDDNTKRKKPDNSRMSYSKNLSHLSYEKTKSMKRNLLDSSFLKFHVNDLQRDKNQTPIPHFEPTRLIRGNTLQNIRLHRNKPLINKSKLYLSKKYAINRYDSNLIELVRKYFQGVNISVAMTSKDETCPLTTITPSRAHIPNLPDSNAATENNRLNFRAVSNTYNANITTTVYDKIKFFEMYDRNTEDDRTYDIGNIDFNCNVEKVLLEHVDENIDLQDGPHGKGGLPKKHILGSDFEHNFKDLSSKILNATKTLKFARYVTTQTKLIDLMPFLSRDHVQKLCNSTACRTMFSKLSKKAMFSDYPFAAVYIFEPSQVHCDAAGISPHWLITSASCLSRHHLDDPRREGRSAFVTYCGVNWRLPDRIAYVKFSLTHPKYHPNDDRKYMYNIGLIKVVSSMASCNGWSPISLMSHQYTASQESSVATAVGWGLDRYVPRQISTEVPLCPLMVYESQIFTKSCPGNYGYNRKKRPNDIFNINYVYCLSLPPYYGEKYDPVHGSLLLAGGKLIALYLQEERRPWGAQSAQYTSIWRLIPWVHDVAQEPEEDPFIAEI